MFILNPILLVPTVLLFPAQKLLDELQWVFLLWSCHCFIICICSFIYWNVTFPYKLTYTAYNSDSNRVQLHSKAEAKTTTNIPKNNSSNDKKTESNKTKVSRKLPSERYRHKCNICNQVFTFRTNLTRHTRKIHRTCPDFPPETTPSAS